MKQKEIVINGIISIGAEEMIYEYFKTKVVNDIQGFVISEKEFLDTYKGTYCFNEWNSTKQYAIYTLDCFMCQKTYEVIIQDREDFYTYVGADYRLCNECFDLNNKLYYTGLGIHLVGNIST